MSWTIDDVKVFAQKAHAGQKRWSGADYYEEHLLAVYNNTEKLLEKYKDALWGYYEDYEIDDSHVLAASLLHDVLEDTEVTYTELIINFGKQVAEIVLALTRPKNKEYAQYIFDFVDYVSPEYLFATIVKLADIEHNSSNFPVDKRNNKYSKYLLSQRILQDHINRAMS